MSAPAPTDHTAVVVGSILGGIYGIAAISAIVFLVIPRLLASAAAVQAAGPAAGVSRVVRAARPRPQGLRWSPAYGGGLARTRTGAYVPREAFEMRRWRGYLLPTLDFHLSTRYDSIYCTSFCHTHTWNQGFASGADPVQRGRGPGFYKLKERSPAFQNAHISALNFAGIAARNLFFKFYPEILCALWKAEGCSVAFYNNIIIIVIIC